MRINKIIVDGSLNFNKTFSNINFILGRNKTGKTTFAKLLLYSLGVDIEDFIPEISEYDKCNFIEIQIEFSDEKKYIVRRNLPKSDLVLVKDNTNNDESLLTLEEYSNFLLEKNGFKLLTIPYGNENKATLRFYFILRALYVDQETSAYKVLSDIGGRSKDYINKDKVNHGQTNFANSFHRDHYRITAGRIPVCGRPAINIPKYLDQLNGSGCLYSIHAQDGG